MGFTDENGTPTEKYGEYQNSTIRNETLVNGIISAYNKLFKAYPNANELSREDLKGYFKQHTGKDDSVVKKLVTTFKHICTKANFDQNPQPNTNDPTLKVQNNLQSVLPITMNIQIVIPSDATSEQYDNIFSSIKNIFLNS